MFATGSEPGTTRQEGSAHEVPWCVTFHVNIFELNVTCADAEHVLADRSTPIGRIINGYLKGETQLDDHAVHLLFSANRWEAA